MTAKRVWVLSIVLVLATGALAIGQDQPLKGWTVGYLPGNIVDHLRQTWSNVFQATVEKAGGKVITIDSQGDATKQVSDGEDILQRNINILVINPNDASAMVPVVQKANAMKIPVVCIDNTVTGGDIVTTVEFDNWKAGAESAAFIAKAIGGKGEVMQVQGALGMSVVYQRGESFRQEIKKYPGIKLVAEPSSKDWLTQDAQSFTEDALATHPNLKAIWTHADQMALGIFNALQEKGKEKDVILVGMGMYSGIPEIIKADKGRVYTWALLPEEVGAATGNACIKIARKQFSEIKKITPTPLVWVGKDNIDENWKYRLD